MSCFMSQMCWKQLEQKRKQQKFISSLISVLITSLFPFVSSFFVSSGSDLSGSSSPLTFSFLSCCDDLLEAVGRPPRHRDPADIFTRLLVIKKTSLLSLRGAAQTQPPPHKKISPLSKAISFGRVFLECSGFARLASPRERSREKEAFLE